MNGLPRLTIAAAAAVLLTTLALVPTMEDLTWLRATVLALVVVAGTGYLARRLRAPSLLIPLAEVGVLAVVLTIRFVQPYAIWELLPGRDAIDAARLLVNEALDTISSYAPPAPVTPGLIFLIAMSVGLVAVVVDTVAVTFRSPALAGLPLLVLYAVPVAVVQEGVSWFWFALGAVGWLVLLLADGRERLSGWGRRLGTRAFAGDPTADVRSAPEPLGAVGRRIGAVSLTLAILLPAVIPGLSESVFGRGHGLGTGSGTTIQTINPFVSLGAELNQREITQLFTYRSSSATPDYISLVSLDDFDGTNWQPASLTSSDRVSEGPLPLPAGLGARTERSDVTTQFSLTGLSKSTWLPVPYPPTSVTLPADRSQDWFWDVAHRVAWSPESNTAGLTYSVNSLSLKPTREQLSDPEPVDPDVVSRDIDLPVASRAKVIDLAQQVTAGAPTAFAQALRLQDWFRTAFSYNAAASPSARDPLGDFLRTKEGFCQQFAGTFAVMARSLGLPTRVVVGFVPGRQLDDGSWEVTSHDVHAWPEVYFQGTGWVRFEPTPRTDNTGVTVPTWTSGDQPVVPGSSESASTPGDSASAGASESASVPSVNLPGEQNGVGDLAAGQRQIPWVWLLGALAVLVVLLLPFTVRLEQRRRRLARTGDPDPRIAAAAAWTELAASCADLGRSWPASRTPRQVAQALIDDAGFERTAPRAADGLRRLALATERGRYARSPQLVSGLAVDVKAVRHALTWSASRWQRLRAALLPASLLSRAAGRTADALDWVDAAPRRAGRLVRPVRRRIRSKVGSR